MLSRPHRISVEQFNSIMEKGKIVHSSLFLARIITGQIDTRIAAVAPQKIIKTAVVRNKIRRNIYEAVRALEHATPSHTIKSGTQILIFAKPTIVKATHTEILTDLKVLFVKAGIMR